MPIDVLQLVQLTERTVRAAQKGASVAGALDPAERLKRQFQAATDETFKQMTVTCNAVVRAILAQALGVRCDDEAVDEFIEKAAHDPTFAPRAYRLIGEGLKTSSGRRRTFLASILFGLQISSLPGDERDRVDMVVEQMFPEDARLLSEIELSSSKELMYVVLQRQSVELVTAHQVFDERTTSGRPVDGVSFANLQSLGCIEVRSETFSEGADRLGFTVQLTALGDLILRALRDVAVTAGLETSDNLVRR